MEAPKYSFVMKPTVSKDDFESVNPGNAENVRLNYGWGKNFLVVADGPRYREKLAEGKSPKETEETKYGFKVISATWNTETHMIDVSAIALTEEPLGGDR